MTFLKLKFQKQQQGKITPGFTAGFLRAWAHLKE